MTVMHVPKSGGTISNKITWNGSRQTFDDYHNKIEGHLLQVGIGYLTTQTFLEKYSALGSNYFSDPEFYEDYTTSVPQACCDSQYLYGILKSLLTA